MRSIITWLQNIGRMTKAEAKLYAEHESIKHITIVHQNKLGFVAVDGKRICTFEQYFNTESAYVDTLDEARRMYAEDLYRELKEMNRIKKED